MLKGRHCVKHKWVLEIKRDGTFHAHLVTCGYSQVGGVDFNLIYAPVVTDVAMRIVLVAKMVMKLSSVLFDVETAFLLGNLTEELYMDCPEGMEHEPGECLQLLQTIYGTVQAARAFYSRFRDTMVDKMGFTVCKSDPCLFIRRNELGLVMVVLHVDDGAAIGDMPAIKSMLEELHTHGLKTTVEETMKDYLSCEIAYNKDETKAWVGQPHMIQKIEKEFGDLVKGLQKYQTPGTPGFHIVCPKEGDVVLDEEQQTKYRSGVGMVLYLIKYSRPDLANPVRELAKCMDKAHPAAWKELLRVIKFVLDTKTKGLKMEPKMMTKELQWEVKGFSDSDWAGDKETRKSVSGFILFLNSVPILWRSKSQQCVSLSSAEAEFIAASEMVKEIVFVVQVLLTLGIPVKTPVVCAIDNMGAIFMTENPNSQGRTRHIDTRYSYIKDLNGTLIEVTFVKSEDNLSDGFTKNVSGEIYMSHLDAYVADKDFMM